MRTVAELSKPAQRRCDPTAGHQSGAADAPTPMMAQYLEIKAKHPDFLLFYRMGDFFELFFDDAVKAADALGIQLTKRGKHLGEDIPMCGVPVARSDEYLHKLIRKGFRVAVAEQLEDPAEAKKRGAKAVVRRNVVRLVTPGTLTEDSLLESAANSFLTAVFIRKGEPANGARVSLASLDLSTGEFRVCDVEADNLPHELARISPVEVIVADDAPATQVERALAAVPAAARSELPHHAFSALKGERALADAFGVKAVESFGQFTRDDLAAIAALLHYVHLTQIGQMPALRPPRKETPAGLMMIDAATRASLELLKAQGEGPSVLTAIDRTLTAAGARELASRLASPLCDADAINRRLDAVSHFRDAWPLRADLRAALRGLPDMARALSRLKLGRGSPRDLGAIRDGLAVARAIATSICAAGPALPPDVEALSRIIAEIPRDLAEDLARALCEPVPVSFTDGQVIAKGTSPELDDLRRLATETRVVLAELQARYAAQTGVKSLKVQYNSIFGYFIEVSASAADTLRAPAHAATFRHRQTLANAVRFTTDEVSDLESRILSATEQAHVLEKQIFAGLVSRVIENRHALSECAAALASLDCTLALAELAEEQNYARPIVDDSTAFHISGGRHPIVEQSLKRTGHPFISNDCHLDAGAADASRLLIVTGPNMGGKSTFLRQNALIAILAQAGSFVPAAAAHIGVVDRLFSRVGASDELARGRSTFMVEMVETAAILHQATARSFVILDEIGRGTATFDGLSIAWAALEHLHDITRCRGLFATHFHELTRLPERLPGAANISMAVAEWEDDIVFLHTVEKGAAKRAYGIQVAKLAGLPRAVISRATDILARLEADPQKGAALQAIEDLPLFQSAYAGGFSESAQAIAHPLDDAVRALDPDRMTPREALDALYELKRLAAGSG